MSEKAIVKEKIELQVSSLSNALVFASHIFKNYPNVKRLKTIKKGESYYLVEVE